MRPVPSLAASLKEVLTSVAGPLGCQRTAMLQAVVRDWEGQGRERLHQLEQHKYETPTLTRSVLFPGQCITHDPLSPSVNPLAHLFQPMCMLGFLPLGVVGVGPESCTSLGYPWLPSGRSSPLSLQAALTTHYPSVTLMRWGQSDGAAIPLSHLGQALCPVCLGDSCSHLQGEDQGPHRNTQ